MELKVSKKTENYFDKVSKKTNRKIDIEIVDRFDVEGMSAAFSPHPSLIKISVLKDLVNDTKRLDRSLAHEITHGLLLYDQGYSTLKPTVQLTDTDKRSINLIGTMVDDIVVNKIIQDEGFEPYGESYPLTLSKEATALKKGKNFYKQFDLDPIFKARIITSRYVLAWGFNEFYVIDSNLKVDIIKYIKSVNKQYKKLSIPCEAITESIKTNDIFCPEGHKKVTKDVLELWHLNNSVELETTIL